MSDQWLVYVATDFHRRAAQELIERQPGRIVVDILEAKGGRQEAAQMRLAEYLTTSRNTELGARHTMRRGNAGAALLGLRLRSRKYRTLILHLAEPPQTTLALALRPAEVVVVDDGTVSWQLAENLTHGVAFTHAAGPNRGNLKAGALSLTTRILGPLLSRGKQMWRDLPVTYYSIFPLDLPPRHRLTPRKLTGGGIPAGRWTLAIGGYPTTDQRRASAQKQALIEESLRVSSGPVIYLRHPGGDPEWPLSGDLRVREVGPFEDGLDVIDLEGSWPSTVLVFESTLALVIACASPVPLTVLQVAWSRDGQASKRESEGSELLRTVFERISPSSIADSSLIAGPGEERQ